MISIVQSDPQVTWVPDLLAKGEDWFCIGSTKAASPGYTMKRKAMVIA